MSIEEQLEFPFLHEYRMRLWAQAQKQDLLDFYVMTQKDLESGRVTLTSLFLDYVQVGGAERFRRSAHERFFYDVPYHLQDATFHLEESQERHYSSPFINKPR